MSERYVGKLERGEIVLTLDMLFKILDICEFPADRFFSDNITTYNEDNELKNLLGSMTAEKKNLLVEFLKQK